LGDYDIEMPDTEHLPADGWVDVDEDAALQTLPPGEEGLYHSHEGKEAIFTQIFEKCRPGYVYFVYTKYLLMSRRRGDARRRAFWVQRMIDVWSAQMPLLLDAYLALAHDGPLNSDEEALAWSLEVIGFDSAS
jgi:hypothetical protein